MKIFSKHKKNPKNDKRVYEFFLTNSINDQILLEFRAGPPTPLCNSSIILIEDVSVPTTMKRFNSIHYRSNVRRVGVPPMKRSNSIRYPANVGYVGEKYKNE